LDNGLANMSILVRICSAAGGLLLQGNGAGWPRY
jgi:hypothetical protein